MHAKLRAAEVRVPTGGDAAQVTADGATLDHIEGDPATVVKLMDAGCGKPRHLRLVQQPDCGYRRREANADSRALACCALPASTPGVRHGVRSRRAGLARRH